MRYGRLVRRMSTVLVAAAALVTVLMPAVAGAQPLPAGPDPKPMALTRDEVGYVAFVDSEGYTTDGPIAASRGYQRVFSGLSAGKVQLLTIRHTVLIGKNPAAAARLVSSLVTASSSEVGRDKLYNKAAKAFAASSQLTVTNGAVLRARAFKAGDAAAEIVYRFATPDGSVQVGETLVRVGGNLSVISYEAPMPGVSAATARQLALAAAAHMKAAGSTG